MRRLTVRLHLFVVSFHDELTRAQKSQLGNKELQNRQLFESDVPAEEANELVVQCARPEQTQSDEVLVLPCLPNLDTFS